MTFSACCSFLDMPNFYLNFAKLTFSRGLGLIFCLSCNQIILGGLSVMVPTYINIPTALMIHFIPLSSIFCCNKGSLELAMYPVTTTESCFSVLPFLFFFYGSFYHETGLILYKSWYTNNMAFYTQLNSDGEEWTWILMFGGDFPGRFM